MRNSELREEIEKQVAALMHVAASCGDQGVAICIENVCLQLDGVADQIEDDDAIKKRSAFDVVLGKNIANAISMGMAKILKEWEEETENVASEPLPDGWDDMTMDKKLSMIQTNKAAREAVEKELSEVFSYRLAKF